MFTSVVSVVYIVQTFQKHIAERLRRYFRPTLCAWRQAAAMLKVGEITQEEYDRWRYRYPEFDTTQRWAKVPSQALSDMLLEGLNDVNN